MTADKRRPASKDSTQEAPIDSPAGQAPIDVAANQGPPKPPAPAPGDSTQDAPIDTPANQAPIDTPASQEAARLAAEDRTEERRRGDAGGASAAADGTGHVDREGAAAQAPRRSPALHPERVWPD